jgi:hypothetical protein
MADGTYYILGGPNFLLFHVLMKGKWGSVVFFVKMKEKNGRRSFFCPVTFIAERLTCWVMNYTVQGLKKSVLTGIKRCRIVCRILIYKHSLVRKSSIKVFVEETWKDLFFMKKFVFTSFFANS